MAMDRTRNPHLVTRAPSARLRPYASTLWWSSTPELDPGKREHVLPTGCMHLVFRLSGPALRLYDGDDDLTGTLIRTPVIGGVRTSFYVKETGAGVTSAGVVLLPGAAAALFGAPAGEFAGRHIELSAVWGGAAGLVLERIAEAGPPERQLAMLDRLLCERLGEPVSLHPAVAQALRRIDGAGPIGALAAASRYSHRSFIALFRDASGIGPKRYARLMRFQQLLAGMRDANPPALGELALVAGYSDQSHMSREFREFAGVSPGQYCRLAPASANHVPTR